MAYLTRFFVTGRIRQTVGSLTAGLLYTISPTWATAAGTDVEGAVLVSGAVALTVASFVWAYQSRRKTAFILPAFGITILLAILPYSLPEIAVIPLGLVGIAILLDFSGTRRWSVTRKTGFLIAQSAALSLLLAMPFLYLIPELAGTIQSHTHAISGFYPLSGAMASSNSPINVIRGLNRWSLFDSAIAPSWANLYTANPVGIVCSFIVPGLAFASSLARPSSKQIGILKSGVLAVLLAALFLQLGTTTMVSAAFWASVIQVPVGIDAYAAAISSSLNSFVLLTSSILAGTTVAWVVGPFVSEAEIFEPTSRRTPSFGGQTALKQRGTLGRRLTIRSIRDLSPRKIVAAVAIFVVLSSVPIASYPVWSGQVGSWTANEYSGSGVSIPQEYVGVNSWLASDDHNLSNTLVLPQAGDWPVLDWGAGTSYQGINPYPYLLSSVPVIDGSSSLIADSGALGASSIVDAGYSSLLEPGDLIGLSPLNGSPPLLVNASGSLISDLGSWSTCPGCGNLSVSLSVHLPTTNSSLEFSANNSVTYGNPNGNGVRFSFGGTHNLSRSPILIVLAKSDDVIASHIYFGVAYGSSLAVWLRPSAVANFLGWYEYLLNLTTIPGAILQNATGLLIYFQTVNATGTDHLWIGDAQLASALALTSAANLASSLYGWSSAALVSDVLAWNTSSSVSGNNGSVSLTSRDAETYGSPNGLRYSFGQALNLTGDTLTVWFQTQGVPSSSVYFGILYQRVVDGSIYNATYANWFSADFSVTIGNWSVATVTLNPLQISNLSQSTGLLFYFNPPAPPGEASIELGFVSLNHYSYPDTALVQRLLNVLNVQYLIVDGTNPSAAAVSDAKLAVQAVSFLRLAFSDGELLVYKNARYEGPLVMARSFQGGESTASVIESLVNPEENSYPVICSSTDCPPSSQSGPPANGTVVVGVPSREDTFSVNVIGPGILILPVSYSPNWIATNDRGELQHVEVNAFANAWIVPSGNQSIALRFGPEVVYRTLVLASAAILLLAVAAFVIFGLPFSKTPPGGRSSRTFLRRVSTPLKRGLRRFVAGNDGER